MGAGARMAAERGLWPEHWRVADLDSEEEALLDLLQADEDLLAVVPGMRSTTVDGENQVLIAVTDRRVVVIGRSKLAAGGPRIVDVTECSTKAPRNEREVPHFDGLLVLDLEQESIARMWARIDALHRCRTATP
jgi:hypothetical protein